MEKKRLLMDQDAIMRAIRRISHEILERNKGLSNALIVGIERRGVILAKRLQAEIERIEGIHIDCESLNVAVYRDDRDARPKGGGTVYDWNTTEKTIILVDDCFVYGPYYSCCFKCINDGWQTKIYSIGRPRRSWSS